MKASDQFKPGDVISALGTGWGSPVVLAAKGEYVLAILPGHAVPFVTWWVDARGQVLSGAYHTELGDAMRSLMSRATKENV